MIQQIKQAVIVIPVYTYKLSGYETASLHQLQKIIRDHPICLVCPESLNIENYQSVLHSYPGLQVQRFSNHFFTGINSYNRLMLSIEFYARFKDFQYILIHQLDCYLFKNELDNWCKQGYDYIGAPWLFYQYNAMSRLQRVLFHINRTLRQFAKKATIKEDLYYKVGNGGLSLRNTQAFIKTLQNTPPEIIEKYCSNSTTSVYNEDVFWSIYVTNIRKPGYKKAARFALDLGAGFGLQLNNNELPFGCHAWYKKAAQWKGIIKELDLV